MQTRLLLIIVLQLAVVFFTEDGEAQTVTQSTLSGTLVSASATIIAPNTSVDVFTTPGAGFFILTQFCQSDPMFAPTLRGSTFGLISTRRTFNECISYEPGIALPQSETLSCSVQFGPPLEPGVACMVTGVLSVE